MERYPQEVQDNFQERIVEYIAAIREMTDEIHFFGQGYDEEIDKEAE
jgi:hypothetical protein